MKVISFNINGLRARLHQLQAIIDKHQPDVIGLQEIKVHDEAFPIEDVEAMGYKVYHHGQKAHYGVAMLCKKEPISVQKGFPTDNEDHQKRMIMVTVEDAQGLPVTILNGYFPQGDNISHETKYPYKRQFYKDLMTYLIDHHNSEEQLIVMGDINISPIDADIGIGEPNRKRWLKTGKCSFQPEEREWLKTLMDWGFEDTFRKLQPEVNDRFSWFDYRSKGFPDNRGLRIDVVLATPSLAEKCIESEVDYELRGIEKPSDHAPIWATFK
ncbi:exodeoxyribonuclease III [Vibrio breoganii]|uniref:Exodeoxyribonuclease III n=1 Tax=Vibrio breoganii TaxID=553239 RepID=A0AAN1CRX5_9VIBR|nr:exodeoxyribonuclease III [Vibrio breoganii]ANO32614.1 exodeoxyribonuclease III [Vibrio breoganii]PMG77488.1 exodeoxyribonuclease III [Vibrio breoganii]PMK41330.1 exodeoxyribonuclease III [Vibrio breoganii]